MAYLKQAKSEEEIKKMTVTGVRKAYNELSKDYNRIIEGKILYCHKCNNFLSNETFYTSNDYASGYFPICKKCLMQMATDYDKKANTYIKNLKKQ